MSEDKNIESLHMSMSNSSSLACPEQPPPAPKLPCIPLPDVDTDASPPRTEQNITFSGNALGLTMYPPSPSSAVEQN